jgi:hypothetical protein
MEDRITNNERRQPTFVCVYAKSITPYFRIRTEYLRETVRADGSRTYVIAVRSYGVLRIVLFVLCKS